MKKIIYITSIWLISHLLFTGCDSFLDVNPAGKVTQDKMFEDVQGYRDAMYGIYATIAQAPLYGENLSYGFMDQLAQLYYNPHNLSESYQTTEKILQYKYEDEKVRPTVEGIWEQSYKCISYINNVLANIVNVNLNSDPDYHLIKGEAHALRAFLHFDLMRLYCDDIQRNPSAGGIPYAYTFDLKNKELFTLKECYNNALKDLNEAQALLANDTLLHKGGSASGYQDSRYCQVNLYAVYGMKSRIFRSEGNLDSAGYYAEKVIASSELKLIETHSGLANEKKYPGNKELIWGVFNNKLYSPIHQMFIAKTQGTGKDTKLRVRNNYSKIYKETPQGPDDHDYRLDEFFGYVKTADSTTISFTRFLEEEFTSSGDQEKTITGICLMRLPEMYYIAAEAAYDKNRDKAIRYFNDVRNSRGAMDIQITRLDSRPKFMQELANERLKEFWGEGQTFFEYKYQNLEFTQAADQSIVIKPSPAIFILPWPRNEKEFGNTNK